MRAHQSLRAVSQLFLLSLVSISEAAHLAVVVQSGSADSSAVGRVVDKLINNYWKFPAFKTAPMTYAFVQASDSVEAMQTVCNSPGLEGIVAVGSCSFVKDVMSVAGSLQVPVIAIYADLCVTNSSHGLALISNPSVRSFLEAAASVLQQSLAKSAAVFYDKFQDARIVEELQRMLSEQEISTLTFQIDDSASNVTDILENVIKAKIRYNVILCKPENVELIVLKALATGTMKINYFWTVIDTGVRLSALEDFIPTNESANILVIRETPVELKAADGGACSTELQVIFPGCQLSRVSMLELKTLEALLSFASAIQNLSESSSLLPSNASCTPLQSWSAGPTLVEQLKQQRRPLSAGSGWLPSSYSLETLATFHDEFTDPARFVRSGRFYLENGSLEVGFRYRDRSLIFPNTFIDFKNRSLRICAVASKPYTEYSNGTFGTPSGVTLELAKFFSVHLNFTYTIFTPPDNQFGAPAPGSPYFTGCIGMVQKGEADFATPFAITTIRSQVIDYSEEFLSSSNSILVKRPKAESKLWNVFAPLSWDSWTLIVSMFLAVPLLIYAFARLSPFTGWNLKLGFAFADEVWLKEYIWSTAGSFLQQGQDFYPFAMSPRTVLAFWWMLTVVIFAAYTGDLTAKLAVTVAKYPIESLDDLVSMPHYKAMVPRGTNIYAAVLSATDGPLLKLRQQWMVVDSFDTCAMNLVTIPDPYLVCISDLSVSLFYADALCHSIYNADTYFNAYYLAMAFPKDAYYLPAFDFLIQRSKANGVMGMITGKFIPQTAQCGTAVSAAAEADAIPLEGVGGAYIVSLGLYVCGAVILAAELLWVFAFKRDPLDFAGF